jgi:hypothetical protein
MPVQSAANDPIANDTKGRKHLGVRLEVNGRIHGQFDLESGG